MLFIIYGIIFLFIFSIYFVDVLEFNEKERKREIEKERKEENRKTFNINIKL